VKQQKALRKSRRRGETAENGVNLGYDEKTTFSCGGSTGEKRVKSHAVIITVYARHRKRPMFINIITAVSF
jgi:hypothetical protein